MLQPARTKFRKSQKGRNRGMATRGCFLNFGEFGLQATTRGTVTARQIEACRVGMARLLKKGGKVWIRFFPDKTITKKPLETRQGKGKGPVEAWGAIIKPGRVLFEIEGVDLALAQSAMKLASDKLPVATQFVTREKFRGA